MNQSSMAVDFTSKVSESRQESQIAPGLNRPRIEFSKSNYLVKNITTKRELRQVHRLRYEVFHREYRKKKFPFGFDKDRFDQWADHLVIIDQRTAKVVGSYRVILENSQAEFYSSQEFEISQVLAFPGRKMELSRACIDKRYRNGAVISLLWKGICEYVAEMNVRWVFGMASVCTMNPTEIADIYKLLKLGGKVNWQLQVQAKGKYQIPNISHLIEKAMPGSETAGLVPSLLKSYLRAGAEIGTDVAIDAEFNCADFFVILDFENLNPVHGKRYKVQ